MAQQEKVPAAKPEDLSSIPSTHIVAGESQLCLGVFGPAHMHCGIGRPHSKYTNKNYYCFVLFYFIF